MGLRVSPPPHVCITYVTWHYDSLTKYPCLPGFYSDSTRHQYQARLYKYQSAVIVIES
jgi:hypothetical protein